MYRKLEAPAAPAAGGVRGTRLGVVRQHLRALMGSPWTPALAILLGYGWWLLIAFRSGHEARDFIVIGPSFVRQAHTSTVIKLDPHYHYLPGSSGYDGQFAYFIALDPIHARDYLDSTSPHSAGPDYRYTRILYPMLGSCPRAGTGGRDPIYADRHQLAGGGRRYPGRSRLATPQTNLALVFPPVRTLSRYLRDGTARPQ